MRAVLERHRPVCGSCGGVDFIDSQGATKLREIMALTESAEMTLRLARLKPEVRQVLENDGVLELISPDRCSAHRAGSGQHLVKEPTARNGTQRHS
jgi:SulP family sulfate permease